jgi:hypothetical protein
LLLGVAPAERGAVGDPHAARAMSASRASKAMQAGHEIGWRRACQKRERICVILPFKSGLLYMTALAV